MKLTMFEAFYLNPPSVWVLSNELKYSMRSQMLPRFFVLEIHCTFEESFSADMYHKAGAACSESSLASATLVVTVTAPPLHRS